VAWNENEVTTMNHYQEPRKKTSWRRNSLGWRTTYVE